MSTIPTYSQTSNNVDIIWMYIYIQKIYIPRFSQRVDEMVHLKNGFKNRGCIFGLADLGRGAGIHGSFHTEMVLFPLFWLALCLPEIYLYIYFSSHRKVNKICEDPKDLYSENIGL